MKIYSIFLFLYCFSSPLFAQAMSIDAFNQRFEQELSKIIEVQETQTRELNIKYMGALLRLENQAKSQGNLELVQAARAEITRVENNQELEVFGNPVPTELKDMQQVMQNMILQYRKQQSDAVVKLVESLKPYADSRSVEATRQNDIAQAVAWRDWEKNLSENDVIQRAYARMEKGQTSGNNQERNTADHHAAVQGKVAEIKETKANDFSSSPSIFRKGMEPDGREKRISTSTPSMQGAGNTQLTGTLVLIEEKDINKSGFYGTLKKKSLTYVPRLSISPIIGNSLERSLVVFDLYKRGSGSKRSIIRTEKIIMPALVASDQVVIDAGRYDYETEEYDSNWSSYGYKKSTEDEFYGFIVTIFNSQGELIYQRASERVLNDYARETPP